MRQGYYCELGPGFEHLQIEMRERGPAKRAIVITGRMRMQKPEGPSCADRPSHRQQPLAIKAGPAGLLGPLASRPAMEWRKPCPPKAAR